MNHFLAIAGLAVACVVWAFVSRWAASKRASDGADTIDEACGTCDHRPTCGEMPASPTVPTEGP